MQEGYLGITSVGEAGCILYIFLNLLCSLWKEGTQLLDPCKHGLIDADKVGQFLEGQRHCQTARIVDQSTWINFTVHYLGRSSLRST